MRWLAKAGRMVLDAVLPPLCLSCGEPVAEPGSLCPSCWGGIGFLAPPWCACCGTPFDFQVEGEGALCGACLADPPPWRRARSVMRYDEASRALVLRFKHADRIEGADAFARWMARAGADLLADADLLVPVPLHRFRLFRRRYNQAAILANAIAKSSCKISVPDLLLRRRGTPSMGHLGREARARNVRAAFSISQRHAGILQGRRILLIDDILTTGATVDECARTLLRGGASSVDVLTLGRVVLER